MSVVTAKASITRHCAGSAHDFLQLYDRIKSSRSREVDPMVYILSKVPLIYLPQRDIAQMHVHVRACSCMFVCTSKYTRTHIFAPTQLICVHSPIVLVPQIVENPELSGFLSANSAQLSEVRNKPLPKVTPSAPQSTITDEELEKVCMHVCMLLCSMHACMLECIFLCVVMCVFFFAAAFGSCRRDGHRAHGCQQRRHTLRWIG